MREISSTCGPSQIAQAEVLLHDQQGEEKIIQEGKQKLRAKHV